MNDQPATSLRRRHPGRGLGAAFACLAAITVAMLGAPLRAQSTVAAEVMVILASTAPGEIAPELASIPALRRGPFAQYTTMSLVARHPTSLVVGAPVEIPLPNGRVLRLSADAPTPAGLYPLHVSIERPDERLLGTTLNAERCVHAFFGGQPYLGGTLILGVRVGDGCR